jgi:anti-sigma factor RsiW
VISCRELVDLLGDIVSDELPSDRRDHVDQHIHTCPSCSALLESYTHVITLTRRLSPSRVPDGVLERLSAALSAQQQQQ